MAFVHGAIMPGLTKAAKSRGFTLANKAAGFEAFKFL